MEIVNVAVLIRKRTLQLLRINSNSLERRKPGTSQLIVSWVSWVAKYRGVVRRASGVSSLVYTELRDRSEREVCKMGRVLPSFSVTIRQRSPELSCRGLQNIVALCV
eukprot:scaffold6681_cov40-Attheya_sp.AAC.1